MRYPFSRMAEATQSSPAAGGPQRFGKYWLDAQLAEGGMSRVMLARLRGPGGFEKKLVVKQILPQLAQDPGFIELFVHEANTLVQMSHPNIVPVYELGVVDGVYFLAMELVEGATVAELLRDGALPEALCAHIGAQICEALAYAHERFGLVHRDVTPRNVIVDARGHVRLLDFGIAAPLAHTGRGELFGSPGYMSPEQARGATLGPQSDLFSLGSVLYEALRGERLAPQDEAPQNTAPKQEAPGAPALPEGELDAELARLVEQLLSPDPAARPASAAEVAARFRTWLAREHPQGVAAELGRLAERARSRAGLHSEPPPRAVAGERSATPRLTRSIATRRQWSELLEQGTEPLGRARAAPRGRRAARRALRFWVLPLLGLMAAALLLQRTPGVGRRLRVPAAHTRAARPRSAAKKGAAAPATSPPTATTATTAAAAGTTAGSAAGGDRERSATPVLTAAPPAQADTATRGRLSVNAVPWAELRLDGRALGTTPQRALSIGSGSHVLQLDCPPLGRQARVPFELEPGQQRRIVVDLNADPPKVTLD